MDKKLNKKEVENLEKRILRKQVLVWDHLLQKEKEEAFVIGNRYKTFLDNAKTEREAVSEITKCIIKEGFSDIDNLSKSKKNTGKYYKIFHNKAIALAIIGTKPLKEGLNIIASHIDSPRLDLKQNPIYDDISLALIKTHYYGGIKKYHWLVRPLALHGRVIIKNGSAIDIKIGEAETDPVFMISDLLPHLAAKQNIKKLSEAFEGEKLNLLAGSIPTGDTKTKNRFKLTVLKHLNKQYKIIEEDLISAEIEAVPAGKARDVGMDKSLIGGYGQDDRICAFTSLEAILKLDKPERTAVTMFFDKEEIGSEGNTGAKSQFLEQFVSDLQNIQKKDTSQRSLREILINSSALSADVNAGIEPDYKDVYEENNAAAIGYGICITKFTGVKGKSGASDANAEYIAKIREIFNNNNVIWQTGELGKIDVGGGGTIAKYLASYGMDIVDCGPPVLSMHSPFEVSNKADVYMTFKAYKAFLEDC